MSRPQAGGPIWDRDRNGGEGSHDRSDDSDPDSTAWEGDPEEEWLRWRLSWRALEPSEWWQWFEQLWQAVCTLRERYRLMVRSGWWEDDIQVEALAALAAWAARYDSGEWDDPPGKLALLYDLQRIAELLKSGRQPFNPDRDWPAFARYLVELGCEPPPSWPRRRVELGCEPPPDP